MKENLAKFENCLELAGTEKEKAFFSNPDLMAQLDPDDVAYKKLKVIHRAHNTDEKGVVKKANWNDGSIKYYPWFEIEASDEHPSGFGFSSSLYDSSRTFTSVGSRLCNNFSADDAIFIAENFQEEYKAFLLEQ